MIRKSGLKQVVNNPADMYMQTGLGGGTAGNSQEFRDARLARLRQDPNYVAQERLNNIGSYRLNQYKQPSNEVDNFVSPYMRDVAGYNQESGVSVFDVNRNSTPEYNDNGLGYDTYAGKQNVLGNENIPNNNENNLFSNPAASNMFSNQPQTRLEDTMMIS